VSIKGLDSLTKLTELDVSKNFLSSIALPDSLVEFDCSDNAFECLDNLPLKLRTLECSDNKIKSLDCLPGELYSLICWGNKIRSLDKLPKRLVILDCEDNPIKTLNHLPDTIDDLTFGEEQNAAIPEFVKLTYVGTF
jgi:hypothetical protein